MYSSHQQLPVFVYNHTVSDQASCLYLFPFYSVSGFVQTVCGTGNTEQQTTTLVADKGLNLMVKYQGLTSPVETETPGRAAYDT